MNEDFDFISRRTAFRTKLATGHASLSAHGAARSTLSSVVAFVDGLNPVPRPLERDEFESFCDAFSQRMLLSGPPNARLASARRIEFRGGKLRKLAEFEATMARLDPAAAIPQDAPRWDDRRSYSRPIGQKVVWRNAL